jgi:hypothetical protein
VKKQSKNDQFVADMKRCRGIDFARIGMQVEVDGHMGTIVGMNSRANLDVVFVNQLKFGKGTNNCHPTWQTRYFDADGNVVADYRTKRAPVISPAAADAGQSSEAGDAVTLSRCAANRDGECAHTQCPRLRDNEPIVSGRHCPLDNDNED